MTKDKILDTVQLRQSTLKDYLNCPLLFKFKHIEKLKPSYRNPAAIHGTVLHELVYLLHNHDWRLDIRDAYANHFEFHEFESDESHIPVRWTDRDKELEKLIDNAEEILEGYVCNPLNQEAEIIYAEQKFRVEISGFLFTGTLDQLRKNADGTMELIDFKSNKQRPTIAYLHNDWQLNLYLYALKYGELKSGDEWIKPNLLPTSSSWYFLRSHETYKRNCKTGKKGDEKGDPLIRTEKGLPELEHFEKDISNLTGIILQSSYYPNPNFCKLCPHTNH